MPERHLIIRMGKLEKNHRLKNASLYICVRMCERTNVCVCARMCACTYRKLDNWRFLAQHIPREMQNFVNRVRAKLSNC